MVQKAGSQKGEPETRLNVRAMSTKQNDRFHFTKNPLERKNFIPTVAHRGHATYIFISRDKNTVYRAISRELSRDKFKLSRDKSKISHDKSKLSRDKSKISRDKSKLSRDKLKIIAR